MLIQDLANPNFETREQAAGELRKLGATVRPMLERALARETDTESRRVLKDLIDNPRESAATYEVRQMLIIDVLEHIKTATALELLGQMAEGKYDPILADEAKKALQRATRRP